MPRRRDQRPDGSRRRRAGGPPEAHRGLLHPLEALLTRAQHSQAGERGGRAQRRRRQQLALARRLLDPLPPALRPSEVGRERFWTVLRWGGAGLLVARLLR